MREDVMFTVTPVHKLTCPITYRIHIFPYKNESGHTNLALAQFIDAPVPIKISVLCPFTTPSCVLRATPMFMQTLTSRGVGQSQDKCPVFLTRNTRYCRKVSSHQMFYLGLDCCAEMVFLDFVIDLFGLDVYGHCD